MKACSNLPGGEDTQVRRRLSNQINQDWFFSSQVEAPVFHREKRTLAVIFHHGIFIGLFMAGNPVAGMSITYPSLKHSQCVIKTSVVLFFLRNIVICTDNCTNLFQHLLIFLVKKLLEQMCNKQGLNNIVDNSSYLWDRLSVWWSLYTENSNLKASMHPIKSFKEKLH